MKNSTAGFTLIELLIVIAIIGILATALIPNLIKARQSAFDSAAQSCAKQISTAEEMYFIENDVYGDLADLDSGATKGCDGTKMDVEVTASGAAGSETYTGSVKHNQGNTTWYVTPDGITKTAPTPATP